ncbi:hypothetical protein [Microbacterium halotolerans]|uniref:hypothetical protein n=1 Tax=Microbacterium halotolerans TaxID=246613 RepID=UPI000E6AC527|nr:hypothetical protein [Microbacterium halotolerans]
MRATLYVEHSVLAFPGTATVEWRSEIASVLDRARIWFNLDVVFAGRDRLDATLHAAVHELDADRAIFGGARAALTSFVGAVALDLRAHRVCQAWLLSTSLGGRIPSATQDSIEKMRLWARVRVLPVRSDVVTPVVADDLEEVFAGFARSRDGDQ